MPKKINQIHSILWKEARKAREKAYAPYSRFTVGAAIQVSDNEIFSAANVENASYGATICAERSAAVKAVSEGYKKFLRVAIVASADGKSVPPCGMCLQVLAEFCDPQSEIILASPKRIEFVYTLVDLLPSMFSKLHLHK